MKDEKVNQTIEYLNAPQPLVIGIEGGPCGGKTTAVNELALMNSPDIVLLPEVATKKISILSSLGKSVIDLAQSSREEYVAFQCDVLREIVSSIANARKLYEGSEKIIISDRVDIGAYVNPKEYRSILNTLDLNAAPYLSLTDKIIYLPTLAKLDPDKFKLMFKNNPSRYEADVNQAVDTCDRNLLSIADHPELSVYASSNMEEKIEKIRAEILKPENEVEAKFIPIETFDRGVILKYLKQRCGIFLSKIAIKQSYHSWNSQEYRLRQVTTEGGDNAFYYAVKSGEGRDKREKRRIIDQNTYEMLRSVQSTGELSKTRYRYLFDIYPGSEFTTVLSADFYTKSNLCMVEIEGFNPAYSNVVYLPGFSASELSARDLI